MQIQRTVVTVELFAGAEPFTINLRVGDPLKYTGGSLIWQAVLSDSQLTTLRKMLLNQCVPFKFYFSEVPLKNRNNPETFRTAQCPQCIFFDFDSPRNCGMLDWPEEDRESYLLTPRGRMDSLACDDSVAGLLKK